MKKITKSLGIVIVIALAFLAINTRTLKVFSQNSPATYTDIVQENHTAGVLQHPTGVSVASGTTPPTVWVSDTGNNVIRSYSGGTLHQTFGTGKAGYVDGNLALAEFNTPTGIAAQIHVWSEILGKKRTSGQYTYVYVNDAINHVVRLVCEGSFPGGTSCFTISTAAGNGTHGLVNGPNTAAEFGMIAAIPNNTLSPQLPFLILDSDNHVIRGWDLTTVSTFAGTGIQGFKNGPKASAEFNNPTNATWDTTGNLYVADAGNLVIRKIDSSGNVTTFAGSGVLGNADGTSSTAQFAFPASVAYFNGTLYVADTLNNKIRKIDMNGNVSTYAGTGAGGLTNGSLAQATFAAPTALSIYNNAMFIADTNNNAIRTIDMTAGQVYTYTN